MIKITTDAKGLTTYQKKNYGWIIEIIKELEETHQDTNYENIVHATCSQILHVQPIDIQLSLLSLSNNGLLNIIDGKYTAHTSKTKLQDKLIQISHDTRTY